MVQSSDCAGKVRFPTFSAANSRLRLIARRKNGKLHAYACEECGLFHIGAYGGNKIKPAADR
jgi:hypothetical protein